MSYRQITSEERYMLSAPRLQGVSQADIARQLGRHCSSISREIRRNQCNHGTYRPSKADGRTRRRRSHSRRSLRPDQLVRSHSDQFNLSTRIVTCDACRTPKPDATR